MDGMDGVDKGRLPLTAPRATSASARRVRPQPHSPAPWHVILMSGGRYHVGTQFWNRAGAWHKVASFERKQDAEFCCLAPRMLVVLQEVLEYMRGDVDAVRPGELEEKVRALVGEALGCCRL